MNTHLNWMRLWFPRGIPRYQVTNSDYVEFSQLWKGENIAVPLGKMADFPCLILLGEPGIGKSTELSIHCESIESQINQTGDSLLKLDLRDFQSDVRLFDTLDKNSIIQLWLDGSHRLFLFLDSLDEALLTINTAATALLSEIAKWPIERLYLRIACRTADWPIILEQGLLKLWGEEKVKILELAPLNRSDIVEAAGSIGIDPKYFIQEIIIKEVEPLASIPVTLNFLLKNYLDNNQIPTQKRELYLNGCKLLCAEKNQSRLSSHRAGYLTSEQRLIIAARIATLSIFTNRAAIWIGAETEDIPDSDINKSGLVGGVEQINGLDFSVGLQEIEETLRTALFSSRGPSRLGWSHQTYAEFLAAWYLIQHHVNIDQILSLIIYPNDPGYLIPQLHETAAWLASFSQEVFHEIMEREPQVLLRSDVTMADYKDRARLIDSILAQYEQEKLYELEWQDYPRLAKLAHLKIADQLQLYISSPGKNVRACRVAINIAEACSVTQLQNDLVNVALNTAESEGIRVEAAYAVFRMGEEQAKARLKPLALGQAGDDPNDELKGCGLLCVWPEHITAGELFGILTPQKQENFSGSYERFISLDLLQNISPKDLPIALDWICTTSPSRDLPYSMGMLVDNIMIKAWDNLDFPEVLPSFAKAVLSRLSQFDDIFSQDRTIGVPTELQPRIMVEKDNEKRHIVVQAILPLVIKFQLDPLLLIHSGIPLILNKDFDWLLDLYHITDSLQEKNIIVSWISRIFNPNDAGQVERIYYECEADEKLSDTFPSIFNAVELNTPRSDELQARYRRLQEWQNPRQEPPLLEPPPSVRINNLLDKFESGEINAWWVLNREMTLSERSTRYSIDFEFQWDLTKFPGWLNSDDLTRERIIQSAKVYLKKGDPQIDTWLGTDTYFRPAFAGYRALVLLLKLEPDYLLQLSSNTWQKWAPMIISRPQGINTPSDEKEENELQLLQLAYHHAPDEIISTLISIITKENQAHGEIFVVHKVTSIWDDRLANALLQKASDQDIKANSLRTLLQVLLRHHHQPAALFAESLVSFPNLSEESLRDKSVVAAQTLLVFTEHGGWSVIWPVLQNEEQFGREVVIGVADILDYRSRQAFQHLTPIQLVDFYHWLIHQFPPAEDPDITGFHSISPRERVGEWRNSIISYLANLATQDACEALLRLVKDYPQSSWLKRYLTEAEANFRRRSWMPPTPKDLLAMIKDSNVRLVGSGEQLLDVIIASLKRLEEKLHGETPAVFDIWNEIEKNRFRPKDENNLSNYLKRHLEDDLEGRGIIANREVEIRCGTGTTTGERTDIHVDAVKRTWLHEEFDVITVIIEVKGCWNEELDNAMETQLKERYLEENQCHHGLYIVGWFLCQEWDKTDPRKSRCPKRSLEEIREKLNEQANSLSKDGTIIRSLVINSALSSK